MTEQTRSAFPLARAAARLFGSEEETPDPVGAFLERNELENTPANRVHAGRLLASGPVPLDADPTHALPPDVSPDVLARLISEAAERLAEAGALLGRSQTEAHAFGAALETTIATPEPDRPLFEAVIGLTRTMIDRTREAEERLRTMGGEMDTMRGNLDEARRSAEVDPLTGLANRRAYERRLADAVAAAHTHSSPVVLAVCDIDHFKRINDAHGHDMGDRILRFVAGILRGCEDADTLVARYGGEEFVILFEHVPLDHAAKIVDDMRQDLAARRLVARETGEAIGEVSFSAGLAPLPSDGVPENMFRAADAALYEAKQAGRDRVVVRR